MGFYLMPTEGFHRDNHYVPRLYLKKWESPCRQVWTYRTLVSHENALLWSERSIKGIAYHAHLYTRIAAGQESDEIERWMDNEFEAPAEEAIQKATSNSRMTTEDWTRLIRFLAAQDVRTPARLLEELQHSKESISKLLEETLKETVRKLEVATARNEKIMASKPQLLYADYFPLHVRTDIEPEQEFGTLKAETLYGQFHRDFLIA